MVKYDPRIPLKQAMRPSLTSPLVVPSGLGDEGIVGNWLFYYLKGGDHLHDFSPYDNHGTIKGACLPADTLIKTEKGVTPISQIEKGDQVYTYSQEGLTTQQVKSKINSGKKEVYRLKTANRSIIASSNHPFLTLQFDGRERVNGYNNEKEHPYSYIENRWHLEWKPLEDLKRGDGIVAYGGGLSTSKGERTQEFMELIGAFLGDGSFFKRNRGFSDEYSISFHLYDKRLEAKYKRILEGLGFTTHRKDGTLIVYDREFGEMLERLDLNYDVYSKHIPSWVWKESLENKKSLLQGMLNADGWKQTNRTYGLELANEELLRDVRHLAIDCGYRVSNVQHREREPHEIEKGRNLPKTETWYFYFTKNSLKDNSKIRIKVDGKRRRVSTIELPLGFQIHPISSIERIGREETYDIGVPRFHNFIANGVVVHNSWKDGRYGWALDFDGVDDYVDLPNNLGLSNGFDFTMTSWINLDDISEENIILGLYDGSDDHFHYSVDNGGNLRFILGHFTGDEINYESSYTLSVDTWYHYVVVWDASEDTVHFYINGSEVDSTSGANDDPFDDAEVMDMGRRSDNFRNLDGTIAIIRVYPNVAKSASWIKRRFARTKGIFGL